MQFDAVGVALVGDAFWVFALAPGFCVFRASSCPAPPKVWSPWEVVCVLASVKDVGFTGSIGPTGSRSVAPSSENWSLSPGMTKRLRSSRMGDLTGLCERRRRRIILRCSIGREAVGKEDTGRPPVGNSALPELTLLSDPSEVPFVLPCAPSELSPSVLFPPVARWDLAPAHQLQFGQ